MAVLIDALMWIFVCGLILLGGLFALTAVGAVAYKMFYDRRNPDDKIDK